MITDDTNSSISIISSSPGFKKLEFSLSDIPNNLSHDLFFCYTEGYVKSGSYTYPSKIIRYYWAGMYYYVEFHQREYENIEYLSIANISENEYRTGQILWLRIDEIDAGVTLLEDKFGISLRY